MSSMGGPLIRAIIPERDVIVQILGSRPLIWYKVPPRKPTADYTTWRGHTLACSVIYCEKQKRYVSVLKNLSLRMWTEHDTNICKGKKITVPYEVDSLWSVPEAGPLIIFKNGAICQIDDSNIIHFLVEKINGVVSFVSVRHIENQTHIAFVLTTQKRMKCHYIEIVNEETSQIVNHVVSSLPFDVETPKGLCLCNLGDNQMEVMLLGDNGQIVCGKPNYSNKVIAWRILFKMDIVENLELIAVVFHKGHVILAQQTLTGQLDCVAYSLKYRMLVDKKSMTTAEKMEKLQLYEVDGRLFLVAGQEIFFMPFTSEPAKLAQFIGYKANIHSSDTVGSKKENKSWTSNGLKIEDEVSNNDLEIHESQANLSNDFLQLMPRIEQPGFSDQVVCWQILAELIERKQFSLISEVLNYYGIVSEAILVDVLSAYLWYQDESSQILSFYKNKRNSDKLISHPLIEQVVSMPINDVFLQEQLNKLTTDQALFLLHYLHRLLKHSNFVQETNWTKVIKWVEWINTLLDAHFHHVAIFNNKSVHEFLRELMATVAVQWEFLENVAALQELIWITRCKSSDVDTWRNASYCIETLDF